MQDRPEQASQTALEEPTSEAAAPEAAAQETEQNAELEALQQKYNALYDQHLRLTADYDNFRKRATQEKDNLLKYGADKTLADVMPVLDNLERATASLSENSDPKMLYQSFRMIYNQLTEGLAGQGLKRIEALGQPFDPNFHEAISQMESAEYPEGTVAAVAQAGYMLHDRVLRPAMVVVSQGAPAGAEQPAPAAEAKPENPFKL